MAQKVNVLLVDDIDGSDAADTVRFGLDDVAYEIDLSGTHSADLRNSIAKYVEHARIVSARGRRGTASTFGQSRTRGSREDIAEMRSWLIDNGYRNDVKDKGRISAALQHAYSTRTPKDAPATPEAAPPATTEAAPPPVPATAAAPPAIMKPPAEPVISDVPQAVTVTAGAPTRQSRRRTTTGSRATAVTAKQTGKKTE
jgi:hypothetical protein